MNSMPSTRSKRLALCERTNAGSSSSDSVPKEETPHESAAAPREAEAAAETSTPAPESSLAPESATPETVPMPTKAGLDQLLILISDGLDEQRSALGSEVGKRVLKLLHTQYDQVLHHLEQNSFAPSDESWWCCAVGRISKTMELLKRGLDDATVLEEFAAALAAVAQQPSDARAAIDVVVLGEEVRAALGQGVVTPVHLDVLLLHLVDVCRAFHQSRSDELPKLQSCVEAVLQAKQALSEDQAGNRTLSTQASPTRMLQDTQVDQAVMIALQDQAWRTLQLTAMLLEKRAELEVELSKGKRRELVASIFREIGVELPQLLLQPTHVALANQELSGHDRVDWKGAPGRLLHVSLGYKGTLPYDFEERSSAARSIHAVLQLLACGVSLDAEAAFRPALLQCYVQSEPACAKLLLRAGATITQQLANQMAPTQGAEPDETRLLVERALEPWSPAKALPRRGATLRRAAASHRPAARRAPQPLAARQPLA